MKIIDYLIYTILILLSLILNLYILCMCIVDIDFHTIKSILNEYFKFKKFVYYSLFSYY